MRITIEPTCEADTKYTADAVQHKIVLEHPWDDLDLYHVIELLTAALVAYGYSEKTIADYLDSAADRKKEK